MAAEQGNAYAQFRLGIAYHRGKGVVQDLVYSYVWFSLGAWQQHGFSSARKKNVAARMTPEQIAEAQKLARECVRKEYKDC